MSGFVCNLVLVGPLAIQQQQGGQKKLGKSLTRGQGRPEPISA